MLLLPFGVEDAPPGRWPWMSALILVTCLLVHAMQPERAYDSSKAVEERAALLQYWDAHPYLIPTQDMRIDFTPKQFKAAERAYDKALINGTLPSEATLEAEQSELRSRFITMLNRGSGEYTNEWTYTPRNGLLQKGAVTSLFVHSGWEHVIGNMVFFLLAAPVLEGLLGPWALLLLFTLGGGAVSLLDAQFGTSPLANHLGASGAVSLLEGVFIVRLARSRVRVLVGLFGLYSRMLLVPAWAWGSFGIARQIWFLWRSGGESNIGYLAHLIGFGLGMVLGALLLLTRLERRLTKPIRDGERLWRDDTELNDAEQALQRRDYHRAEQLLAQVIERRPTSTAAAWGLAQAQLALGRAVEGTRSLESALRHWVTSKDEHALSVLGEQLDPERLRPAMAFHVAPILERLSGPRARAAYAHAAAGGIVAARVRLAELQLVTFEEEAADNARLALSAPDLTPALATRARQVLSSAGARSLDLSARSSRIARRP